MNSHYTDLYVNPVGITRLHQASLSPTAGSELCPLSSNPQCLHCQLSLLYDTAGHGYFHAWAIKQTGLVSLGS